MDLKLAGSARLLPGAALALAQALPACLPKMVGRFGLSEEIAHVVSMIASPAASFMIGANIRVNGGKLPCVN